MSLQVSRKTFAEALAHLRPVMKGASPLLRNVLVTASAASTVRPDAPRLTIAGTDTHHCLQIEIAAQGGVGDEPGFSCLVDQARLAAYLGADWAEEVKVSYGEGHLRIQGETEAAFATEPAENFPTLPAPPAGAEWVDLWPEAVEEIGRLKRFCLGEGSGSYRRPLEKYIYLFEDGGQLGVFAGGGHLAFWRLGLGETAETFHVELTKEAADLLVALAGKKGCEALRAEVEDGPRHDFVRGEGWRLSQVRAEEVGDPLAMLRHFAPDSEGRVLAEAEAWRRVVEAMPDSPAALLRPMKISAEGILVKGEAETRRAERPSAFPDYWTHWPSLLASALSELSRIAGEEGEILISTVSTVNLRLEVAGRSIALVTGMQQR